MAQPITNSDLNNQNPSQNQNSQTNSQSNVVQPGTPNNQSQPSYNPNKQQGTGYTNISQVVNANQGNKLGQTIGTDVQQSGQNAQNQVNQSQQQFNQQTQANQANTSENAQLAQNVLNNPTQYAQQTGQPGQQAAQFQQLMSGAYQGPTGLSNAQQLQSNAQNVGQMGQALNSTGGRTGLLQQFVGNPQYNQGEQTLDSVLLGQSNAPQLAAAKQQALQLQGQTNNAISGAQATGQQQTQQSQQFGQALQNQFGQSVAGINSGLQQQAASAQQGANKQYQDTLAALKSGNITQQQAQLLGLTNGEQVTGNTLQNIGSFLQENPQQATAQNVANQQQYAQLTALQQLGGNYAPQQAQQTLQQYAGQSGQAGQFAANPAVMGNSAAFNAANQAQINNYNSIVNPAQANLQAAQNNYNNYQGSGNGSIGYIINQGAAKQALATDQAAYNSALANANAGTGGLQTFNISNPTPPATASAMNGQQINPQVAALQQIQQGNS